MVGIIIGRAIDRCDQRTLGARRMTRAKYRMPKAPPAPRIEGFRLLPSGLPGLAPVHAKCGDVQNADHAVGRNIFRYPTRRTRFTPAIPDECQIKVVDHMIAVDVLQDTQKGYPSRLRVMPFVCASGAATSASALAQSLRRRSPHKPHPLPVSRSPQRLQSGSALS